jgi:Fibronectin type-III domain
VYDAAPADYGRFLCGLGLTPPAGTGTCATLGSIQPWNLNLASLTASDVPGTLTLTRRVTNVTGATVTYNASTTLAGWDVVVTPATLTLAPGASASFTVALTRTSAAVGAWVFGNLTWSDGVTQVRSPLSARGIGFVAPAEVSDVRAAGSGSKVYTIVSAYTGSLGVSATGLVPAALNSGLVASATAGITTRQCFNVNVPAGAEVARFQLFNADTQGGAGTDLDLDVYRGANGVGTLVGSSGGSTSDEVVTLRAPTAAVYSACITGYATPASGAAFTLSNWIVGPAAGAQTLRASGPNTVYAGGAASIGLRWTVPAGQRYLGNVRYFDPNSTALGSSIISVDNH